MCPRDVGLRRSARPYPDIVPLLDAAYAAPRLRRLFPFTSHFALCFGSSTGFPRTEQAGSVTPLLGGRFQVRGRRPRTMLADVATAQEAVHLVLQLLPADSEPVMTA